MELELHRLDMRYQELRVRNASEERRLLTSLAERGQLSPILVLAGEESESGYVVIDGFRRIWGLKRLGRDTVEATVLAMGTAEALLWVYHQARSPGRSMLEEARLIQLLKDEHGLSQTEIAHRLGHNKSWVSRRLGLLSQLPKWMQDAVGRGEVQGHAACKYLIPLARANFQDAETLTRNIAGLQLSTRSIGRLYELWRRGDPSSKRLVVQEPQVALRALEQAEADQAGKSEGDVALLCQDIEKIISISRRAWRTLEKAVLPVTESFVRMKLANTRQRMDAEVRRLSVRINKEVNKHDRPGDQEDDPQASRHKTQPAEHCQDAEDIPQRSFECY